MLLLNFLDYLIDGRKVYLNKKLAKPYRPVEKFNWQLWERLKPIIDNRVITNEDVLIHQSKNN